MEVFSRIAGIILPVFMIIAAGYLYTRMRGASAKTEMAHVNRISSELLCPLLLFSALASKDFDVAANLPLLLAGGLIALGSGLLAWPLARLFGFDARTFVPPMIYNNCGNMGLPLAVLAFGQAGLPQAVALFMACSLAYFTVGIRILEHGRDSHGSVLRRMAKNPMMQAMTLGMLFAVLKISLPGVLMQALRLLGEASIPLMLLALGVRMTDVDLRSWRIGLIGAVVCPLAGLATAMALDPWLTLTAQQRGQMYLFAALPPSVMSFMVAESFEQEPDKVAAIVLLGNLAALGFVPLGLWMGL